MGIFSSPRIDTLDFKISSLSTFLFLVVTAEAQTEEEEQTEEEKYNEMMASISMSRMKELGLKPPEAIANLETLPAKLGEQLNNMTEEAMKHVNKTKISEKLKGTEKLIEPPPKPKKPTMTGDKDEKNLTILRVPSSPGQELVEELPGVKPLKLPGDENEKQSSEKNKNKNGEKAKPPPAQEEGTDGESGLSIGESGEEGPAEGQDTEEEPADLPMKQQRLKKIKPKKPKEKKKKKKKKPESKAPEIPPQLKNPDLKAPQLPKGPPPPPSPYYYGIPGYKKHKVGDSKPFSITFGGKQVTNVQSKDNLRKHHDDEDSKLKHGAESAVGKNEGLLIYFFYPSPVIASEISFNMLW